MGFKKIGYGELIKRFRDLHAKDAISIPMVNIVITERQHLYPKERPENIKDDGSSELLVIVCPDRANKGKYKLLTGWKDYYKACRREVSHVNAIIIPFIINRYKFLSMLKSDMNRIWVKHG